LRRVGRGELRVRAVWLFQAAAYVTCFAIVSTLTGDRSVDELTTGAVDEELTTGAVDMRATINRSEPPPSPRRASDDASVAGTELSEPMSLGLAEVVPDLREDDSKSFATRARLARVEIGKSACAGDLHPFKHDRIAAVGREPKIAAKIAAIVPNASDTSVFDTRTSAPSSSSTRIPPISIPFTDIPTMTEFDRAPDSSPIDEYLCGVYWRMPHKIDDAGDFSWKDEDAATRVGRTVCDYAIKGMHPDLRELLYVLGHKADDAGINWSFLSAFRDDYRQNIASGFKAQACGSWHGGSCRTKGWGDGRAADLWIADQNGYPVEDASVLLTLIDQVGPSLGLSRPLQGADPPHVQVSGEWEEIGQRLRAQRLPVTPESGPQAIRQAASAQ
jgi:hypothetical protein